MLLNLISRKTSESESEKSQSDSKGLVTHYSKAIKREDLPQKFKLLDCLKLLVGKLADQFESGFDSTLRIKNGNNELEESSEVSGQMSEVSLVTVKKRILKAVLKRVGV